MIHGKQTGRRRRDVGRLDRLLDYAEAQASRAAVRSEGSTGFPAADLANVNARMADLAQRSGALDDARAHVEDVLAIRRRTAEAAPGDAGAQADLSIALVRVGDVAGARGDAATRKHLYEQVLAIDLVLVQA